MLHNSMAKSLLLRSISIFKIRQRWGGLIRAKMSQIFSIFLPIRFVIRETVFCAVREKNFKTPATSKAFNVDVYPKYEIAESCHLLKYKRTFGGKQVLGTLQHRS